jgi:hypothetical protein
MQVACGALWSIIRSPSAPFSRLSSRLRRALVDLLVTDTHFWRLQLHLCTYRRNAEYDGCMRCMGVLARAGVRHKDGRTPRPYRLRRTHAPGLMYSDSRPVKLADSPPSTYRGARRCAGMRTAQADKMPNLDDLSLPCHRRWSLTLGVGASVVGTRAPLIGDVTFSQDLEMIFR